MTPASLHWSKQLVKPADSADPPVNVAAARSLSPVTSSFLVRHVDYEQTAVLRVLRAELATIPELRSRFSELAKQSLRYRHQNLVVTQEMRSLVHAHVYYTTRDYIAGETLQRLLDVKKEFSLAEIGDIARQILDGLSPLHEEDRCHGGVKPSNILVCKGGC